MIRTIIGMWVVVVGLGGPLQVPKSTGAPMPDQIETFAVRDKSGTTAGGKRINGPQRPCFQHLASRVSFQAEGTGLEPATPYGAPHFQ